MSSEQPQMSSEQPQMSSEQPQMSSEQLQMSSSPIMLHPTRPVVVWAAGQFLFALNLEKNKFECHRLAELTGVINSIDFCASNTEEAEDSLCQRWVVSGGDKAVLVLSDESFKVKDRFLLRKRPTAIKVCLGGRSVIFGDKFGELYQLSIVDIKTLTQNVIQRTEAHLDRNKNDNSTQQWRECVFQKFQGYVGKISEKEEDADDVTNDFGPTTENETGGDMEDGDYITPFAGHLAAITAMEMSSDKKLLISADRDEKLRVCRVQDPYVTTGYGLGHTEFITALCCPEDHPSLVASAAADRTLRLWDITNSRLRDASETAEGCVEIAMVELPGVPSSIKYSKNASCFLVVCEGVAGVFKVPLTRHEDGRYCLGERPSLIALPQPPLSILPIDLTLRELSSFSSFCDLTVSSSPATEVVHGFLWMDSSGRLHLPHNIATQISVFRTDTWLGLETGDKIAPATVNLWKRTRLSNAPSVEEMRARRKRGCPNSVPK